MLLEESDGLIIKFECVCVSEIVLVLLQTALRRRRVSRKMVFPLQEAASGRELSARELFRCSSVIKFIAIGSLDIIMFLFDIEPRDSARDSRQRLNFYFSRVQFSAWNINNNCSSGANLSWEWVVEMKSRKSGKAEKRKGKGKIEPKRLFLFCLG